MNYASFFRQKGNLFMYKGGKTRTICLCMQNKGTVYPEGKKRQEKKGYVGNALRARESVDLFKEVTDARFTSLLQEVAKLGCLCERASART